MNINRLLVTFFAVIFMTISANAAETSSYQNLKSAPLWYESWWFYLLSLLIGVALICGIFRHLMLKRSGQADKPAPSKEAESAAADQSSHAGALRELRTPLTLILGPLESMVAKLDDDDPNAKRLKGMYKQALRMRSILDMKDGVSADSATSGAFSGARNAEVPKPGGKNFVTAALKPVREEEMTAPVINRSMLKHSAPEPAPFKEPAPAPAVKPAPVVKPAPAPAPDPISVVRSSMGQAGSSDSMLPTQEDVASVIDLKDASILLVEDDFELRSYIREELLEDAKQVFVAGNGLEAIEVLNRQNIDVIVSDVMMPEMDGFALCRYVKTTVAISHIPVILLTARTDENSRLIGYKNGADDYITKPFDINFLKTAICNLFLSRAIVRQRFASAGTPDVRETTFSSADENFMVEFDKLVRENISDPNLDVRMLVEGMNMSRTVLFNKVKQLTGMNLQNYVNKCRMEYVIDMMKNSNLPLAEIAERSGFNSPRYFSTSFKNYTGKTPSQYKREVIDAGK